MANSYSNIEAQEIIASANAAAVAIGGIIRERLEYELEIADLYKKLLDEGGNELARSISLVRTGPGKYRTPAAGKKGGTASNLYLAATSGTDAVIETRSGTYRAQECYKRVLDAAGINECDDAFEDLVFAGYKRWLHEEILDKPLSEWKALKATIERDAKAAEPAMQGGLSRLFMNAQAKQEAFDALDELKSINVAGIVFDLEFWHEKSTQTYFIKEDVLYSFRHSETTRNDVLRCLHAQLGDFELNGGIRRPFYSDAVQQVLDELEGISGVRCTVSAARQAVADSIPAAIEELKESDVLAKLAQHPIEELAEAKTGAQIKKLQDAGVHTLADLYERLNAPERGELPGVGAKTRSAVERFLDPIVAEARSCWSLHLSAREQGEAATRLVRTVGAHIELGKLLDKAQEALAGQDALSAQQTDDLLFATDDIDWLLTDDDHVQAASGAMDAARAYLDTKDGAWLLSLSRGSKIKKLEDELVSSSKAWKDFEKRPDAFYEVIEQLAPEALVQPEQEPASVGAGQPEAAPAVEAERAKSKRNTAESVDTREPHEAPRPVAQQKAGADLLEQTRTFYQKFEGLTMMFPPAEDAPVFNAKSKYSVRADAPRAQGSTFSLAIPDGWVSEKDTSGRAFVLVPEEHAGEGVDSNIAILYGDAPVPDHYASNMQKIGVDPALWSLNYEARSCRSDFTLEMHEVQARNCRCAVVRVPTADEECSEFYIYPYSLIGQDYARVTFYDPGDVTYEQARTFVDNLARTVEASGSTVPACLDQLEERFLARSNDFSFAYREVFMPVMDQLANLRNSVLGAGARFCEALNLAAGSRARNISGIIALSQFFDACIPIAVRFVDVIEEWARVDRSQEFFNRFTCKSMLEEIGDKFIISSDMFYDSALSAEELEKLCVPSPRQRGLLERISHALVLLGFDEYDTGKKNETVIEVDVSGIIRDAINHFASQSDSELQSHVVTEDDDQAEELEGRLEPAEQQSSMSARARKILAGQITPDQYDSPTVICNLLAQRTFFFDSEDIAWDGRHHTITNVNVNASQAENLSDDALNILMNETGNTFGVVLTEIEKDELLFVPRSRIASGIEQALPEGDLTGITLCYLIGCLGAFSWRGTENCYQVYFDPRLEKGIPQFFSLVARLIWDIRDQFLMSEDSFDIMFFRTRNFDADAFLGDVDEPVIGAQDCPNLLNVREQPSVDLSDQSAKTNC